MAVILRLQGLNIEAGPEDIRGFFHGLHIPEGRVHIIGGKLSEAFIIFASKSDGQLALQHSGKLLRGSTITLHVSSYAELMHKMVLQLKKQKAGSVAKDPLPQTPVTHSVRPHGEGEQRGSEEPRTCKPGYLRLYGLPNGVTKQEICHFLGGLSVFDVVLKVYKGRDQCCLVKVASVEEAKKGLTYSNRTLLTSSIQVRLAHERMWTSAVEEHDKIQPSASLEQEGLSPDTHSCHDILGKRRPEDLLMAGSVKRHCSEDGLLSGAARHRCSDTVAFAAEYCVMIQNLPKNITKTEIKGLFLCPNIPNNKILHLLNKWRERTSTAFIVFSQPEDYALAMNMDGRLFGNKHIDVTSITKEKMRAILRKNRFADVAKSPISDTRAALSCIYARNFPADMSKAEVRDFFAAYSISDRDVTLLENSSHGIGEAVVRLTCEKVAQDAHQALNGRVFMGEQVLLTCISPQQTMDILHKA